MGNLKQKLIKAGRDFNYAEGVKVKATTAVYADQIVYPTGSSGPFITVATADADGGVTATGRLLIAKHDIPAGGYGVCLPWKLVTNFNTLAGAVGDPVFLSTTPGAATASNLTLTAPSASNQIIVGRVTVDATAGAVLVNASAPESRVQSGVISASGAVVGRPIEQVYVTTAASTANIDLTFDYPITVTDVHAISAGASTGANVTVQNGTTNLVTPFAFGAIKDITRAGELIAAQTTIAAGDNLRVTKSASGTLADLIVVTFIRA